MASVALGYAGRAIGAAIGGPIGAAIGGYIGQAIGSMIDNELFPSKAEGPRLNDLTVTSSTYGQPLPLIFGPENRLAGNIIWSSGLIETKRKVKQGGKGGPVVQTTEYSYRSSIAVAVGEGRLNRLRKVWANNNLIFDADAPPPVVPVEIYSALRFYHGDFEQLPDPTMESFIGAGKTPAYRGTAYVVIADLQLADFGNRLPNLEFLIEAHEEIACGEIVADIVQRCGLDMNLASTVALTDSVRGYVIGNASSGIGAMQPLALAFDFDVAEVGGALRCVKRTASSAGIVLSRDLAGHDFGSQRPDVLDWTRAQITSMPREATVTFPDPERDWQPSSQVARRSEGSADSNLSNEIPIVMTADAARALADRLLWQAWTGIQTAEASTDDRWLALEPARSYLFETPAGLEPLRITRLTRGWNGVIEMSLKRDRDEVYLSTAAGVPSTVPPNDLRLPGLSKIILLDIPLLLDADNAQASGFYWGVLGSGNGWRGADFLRAVSPPSFENIAPQGAELTLGEVALPTPAPAPGFDSRSDLDMTTVIRVTMARETMTLSGVTDAEMLAGSNAIYLGPDHGHGGEIIQFGVADLVSPGVYDLSRLRRGQRGTEFAWGSHAADEMLVLLEIGSLRRSDFGVADLNLSRAYKAVSLLTLEVDTPAVAWANTGVGLRPYSPVDLIAEGETGGDVLMKWTRRSRIGEGVVPPPLAEETEAYVLRILTAGGALKREVALSTPSFTYTVAMQTADFGAPVTTLRWQVAQVSTVFGPGPFAESNGPV